MLFFSNKIVNFTFSIVINFEHKQSPKKFYIQIYSKYKEQQNRYFHNWNESARYGYVWIVARYCESV